MSTPGASSTSAAAAGEKVVSMSSTTAASSSSSSSHPSPGPNSSKRARDDDGDNGVPAKRLQRAKEFLKCPACLDFPEEIDGFLTICGNGHR